MLLLYVGRPFLQLHSGLEWKTRNEITQLGYSKRVRRQDPKSSGWENTDSDFPAGEVPCTGGADWGMQYWMYISDWNYKFGSDKEVARRIAPNNPGITAPRIFLSPAENTLNIRLSIYPGDNTAGASAPGAGATGDSFTCSVENVPLQSWFSVSVTVFQRNMDIYINGRLVKSCVIPGIPGTSGRRYHFEREWWI
jgi:hypothetical protein